MSDNKKYFPEGFIFKEPHPNAPDFVKGQVSIKVEEFQRYLSKVKGEWLNLDLKIGRSGKPYAEVNTFKPDSSRQGSLDSPRTENAVPDNFDDMDDDLPF